MSDGVARKSPLSAGESEAPIERAIVVTPDAAERSSGATTAMVYDCRVGTSICEILKRRRSTTIANGNVGMSGTRHSRTFEGICVNTIVLIRPMRAAMRAASNAEIPAKMFAPKKMLPSRPTSIPYVMWNQYARRLCTTKPPANASTANKALSFITTRLERCSPKVRWAGNELAVVSTDEDRHRKEQVSATPPSA